MATMAPTTAIDSLQETMTAELNKLRAYIADEADAISEEWYCLGVSGGQREDHAAALLARLRPSLQAMSRFCDTCESQIDSMVADPFGTK